MKKARRDNPNAPSRTPESQGRCEGSPFDTHRTLALLALGSLVLLSLIFAPIGAWPLSFLCLVPWLILLGKADRAPRAYFYSYVMGLCFYLINMRWLHVATATPVPFLPFRVGFGYLTLAAYHAAYYPLIAIAVRHVTRRRRWPLALVFPFIWTGSEIIRGSIIAGFPWFFLSHSLHGVLPLIQISDLLGAYGVTFMVAAVNGALADVYFNRLTNLRETGAGIGFAGTRFSPIFAASVVGVVLIYGVVQLNRDTTSQGPRVAILQGDFLSMVFSEDAEAHDRATSEERMSIYFSMLDAAAVEKPDLFLLPETPWFMILNPSERDFYPLARVAFAEFQARATRLNAHVVTGSSTLIRTPHDLLAKERRHNSATLFKPDGSEPGRYDKRHLVLFGEYVPFRYGRLRFLYFWLNRIMPFSGPNGDVEYSFFPGESSRRFTMNAPSLQDQSFRFGIPICYEDVMPYISRGFTAGGSDEKQVDFLLNISNDGWFGRGSQQPQHLSTCVFRAVENRVGIARAVNTGVSAFIQPSGRVHNVISGSADNPWPGRCGYTVANLQIDSRFTFYSRYGDWFAWGCAIIWFLIFCDYWVLRVRTRNEG